MDRSNHLHTLQSSLPFLATSLQLGKICDTRMSMWLIQKKQHPTPCRIHIAYCVMLTADADYAKYILVALKMF